MFAFADVKTGATDRGVTAGDDQTRSELAAFSKYKTIKLCATTFSAADAEVALHQKLLMRKDFSRKGAKTPSAAAFLKGFFCAFAVLRETISSTGVLFVQSS